MCDSAGGFVSIVCMYVCMYVRFYSRRPKFGGVKHDHWDRPVPSLLQHPLRGETWALTPLSDGPEMIY